ncbi:Carbonic anhydrase [Burkholderiales bacterium]|nr:Carbonic anhydrase [Burkholderiales bacterium]
MSRRFFLRTGALAALAPWRMGFALAAEPPVAGAPPPPNAITPAQALKRLMQGNARYVANTPNQRDFSSGRAARVRAQYPIAAILSCADSRVAPEFAYDQGPGELFVVRVAGNSVSLDVLASLEYSVQLLGVPLVMVLGHSGCGALEAAIKVLKNKAVLPGHLPEFVDAFKPAVIAAQTMQSGDLLDNAIAENVRQQVTHLKTSPPVIQSLYADNKIDIVGGVYDLATGKIMLV